MLLIGILLGLGCALAHALSYLFTRAFVSTPERTTGQLLALGHIIMAAISLPLLPLLWTHPAAGWRQTLWPLLGAGGFYLLAQGAFFITLRHIAASRASPLLGIKLVFIALFGVIGYGATLSSAHWAAVCLAVVAGLCLSRAGGSLSPRALLWLVLTCMGYALSDLNIQQLILCLDPEKSTRATLFAVAIEYVCCGFYGALLLQRLPRVPWPAWKQAVPFALAWYAAMCFFYAAIASLGVVFAVILQSTRGLMSIGLGSLVAHWGLLHIEAKVEPNERLAQIAAAILMISAIGLYVAAPYLMGT